MPAAYDIKGPLSEETRAAEAKRAGHAPLAGAPQGGLSSMDAGLMLYRTTMAGAFGRQHNRGSV